jgi:hypothetical protein
MHTPVVRRSPGVEHALTDSIIDLYDGGIFEKIIFWEIPVFDKYTIHIFSEAAIFICPK